MNEEVLGSFLEALAGAHSSFRETKIQLAKSEKIQNLAISVSPFQLPEAVSLTFFLDGDFTKTCRDGMPIGLSLKVELAHGVWLLEEYIHFPEGDLDWYEYTEHELRCDSAEQMLKALPSMATQALDLYQKVVLSA